MSTNSESSLRISLFVYSFRGGGAEKMMIKIANKLQKRGHKVELILVQAAGPYESLIDPSLTTSEIGGENTIEILYNLWQHLRESSTDVLLSTMEIPNIVSALATRRSNSIPVVLRVANINSKKERSGKYKTIPAIKRLTYPWAEAIITISDGVACDLAAITNLQQDGMTTIYNPAYNPEIPVKARESINHKWLNSEDKRVAIGVGNMKPQKDFATLIRAIHRVNREEDLYLVILGEGDLKDDLEVLAEELGVRDRVSFPGFVENPYAYMAKADVFVLSSAWEGFGNVIVEAMACGTPVICTGCPGGPSEILDGGTYGPLVPVGDAETMSKAIQEMLQDPTDERALTVRAKDFSIEKIVEEYEQVLASVAN